MTEPADWKSSTWVAVCITAAVIGIILAHVFTRQAVSDPVSHLCLGLLVLAGLAWNSNVVDGWIKALIDHLPSFGRKPE